MFATILAVVTAVLSALIGVLIVVAPLTKSDVDNKILNVLRWLRDMLARVIGAEPGNKPMK